MSKYDALTSFLVAKKQERVTVSFSDIEAVLGFRLPKSARAHRPWWANSGDGHVQARGWLDAGFQSQDVDLETERLTFVRLHTTDPLDMSTVQDPVDRPKAHPLIGSMTGTFTIAPGVDLTAPSLPDWEDATLRKFDRLLGRAT